LDGTGITSAGLAIVAELPALRILSLDDTAIGDEGASYLMRMKSLQVLSLVGTHLSAASADRLKAALIGCEVRTGGT
jgi:non-ribosomal peptide synthetase component E (peptide arylation enzyme)